MFRANEKVIYRPRFKHKGLEEKPMEAVFLRIDRENRAVILVKKATEFTFRKAVCPDFLEKINV